MKAIVNTLSWMAFFVIAMTICLVSLYVGAESANYLHDLFHMSDWECLLLIPMMILVAIATACFFILGLKRAGIQYQN